MYRIIEAEPRERYRVWLKYQDGIEGVIDLSHLAGRGIFKKWDEEHGFEQVRIGRSGDLQWGDDLDLCPDALYMQLTGKTVAQLFPGFSKANSNA